jgi:hypothetical protein
MGNNRSSKPRLNLSKIWSNAYSIFPEDLERLRANGPCFFIGFVRVCFETANSLESLLSGFLFGDIKIASN